MVIELAQTEQEWLEAQAHKRGYATIKDYVLALAEADVEDDEVDIRAELKEGLRAAIQGKGLEPIETLWDDDDE